MKDNITFRPITENDMDFLYRVYASTREDELAVTDWDDAQKEEFLKMQFNAQHVYYQEHYPEASFQVILLDNKSVGRLYLERLEEEFRLIDIALLPEYRNKGIGTGLIRDVMAEAAKEKKPVRIHVEEFNPAIRLYERLKFKKLEMRGVYWFMEWSPKAQECND
jgi:ribosomal protein S18 acetylase RimI-like enzyme